MMDEYKPPIPDYPTELIDLLKPRMNHEIVKVIAMSDCGMDATEHKAAIRRIIDEPRIPRPMEWEPREPFELTRWWTPENHQEYEIRALSLKSCHIARAFSCACLIATHDEGISGAESSLPGLLESCYEIDHKLLEPLRDFVAWAHHTINPPGTPIDRIEHSETVPCLCGLLIIDCMRGVVSDDLKVILKGIFDSGDQISLDEITYHKQAVRPDTPWIFKHVFEFCTPKSEWVELARRWLLSPPTAWDEDTRSKYIDIGMLMIPKPQE
jgi:hypothetical protein